jgi:hypothetical protein
VLTYRKEINIMGRFPSENIMVLVTVDGKKCLEKYISVGPQSISDAENKWMFVRVQAVGYGT